MTVRRHPLHPSELNSKLHVQLDNERHIAPNTNQRFDIDLNDALNPLMKRFKLEAYHKIMNRFKLEAYHTIRKLYSIKNSLLDQQKLYVMVKYLVAIVQIPRWMNAPNRSNGAILLRPIRSRNLRNKYTL